MEAQLRSIVGGEIRRRYGIGMLEGRIKPVHIANALMRCEHQAVGRMADLKLLMTATAGRETADSRIQAVRRMLERDRDRWGRLADDGDALNKSVLVTRVLPLLRTILGTDNAAFGKSPEFSSFSSPTGLTVTRDASDDHAGEYVFRTWGGKSTQRLPILDLVREISDPHRDLALSDDLTAVLAPLTEHMSEYRGSDTRLDEADDYSPLEITLRQCASDLYAYETALKPNPIASLQRIVLLAALSIFCFASSRATENRGEPRPLLLVDASGERNSAVAVASELLVSRMFTDARNHMGNILGELMNGIDTDWASHPAGALGSLVAAHGDKPLSEASRRIALDIEAELVEAGASVKAEYAQRLGELIDGTNGRSLDGFVRLLGIRTGLLYPQQKNPQKRVVPMDRTVEVLVASTFDVSGKPIEYREFLDRFYARWRIVVGGRLEDSKILADAGAPIPSADLLENGSRFLARLRALGLAKELADSVAVVGVMEGGNVG
jgi:hypothetical protein